MKKAVRVVRKDQQEKLDMLFWLEKAPEEKLSALQLFREQYVSFLNKLSFVIR